MDSYRSLVFPALARLDPETTHDQTLKALSLAQRTPAGRQFLRTLAGAVPLQQVRVGNLVFPNVLGMAAGFDKDARVAAALALLGFGHVEVGTLTPQPQTGNPRPRVFRLREDAALINRMGFPNGGAAAALPRLRALASGKRTFVLGVSLGKQKETPLAEAADDYLAVMRAVYPFADYLAVNISSPNTPGLRELQGGRYLDHLLGTLVAEGRALSAQLGVAPRPLWVKIAPDLAWAELDEILVSVEGNGIDGIIAVNTTLTRPALRSAAAVESGGLSGQPLRERSTEIIAYIARRSEGRLPIIGVGGVKTAGDVQAKLDAGAALVQLYTALVYEGPRLPGRILRERERLKPDEI